MTTLSLPVYNADALAKALRTQNLPGQRSKTKITLMRRERSKRRPVIVQPLTVEQRLHDHLVDIYEDEIQRRGGEIAIQIDNKPRYAHLRVTDRHRDTRMVLLHVSAWRYYSRNVSHHASLSYLCGSEDGQRWAVRVPGTITTVADALTWITPKAVKDARAAGRQVWRQGDVYAIATSRAHDGKGELPENHHWDSAARVLSHPEHGNLYLPDPIRFVPQIAYGMGRGAGHAYAD
ncbi:hypothetical protein ABZ897_16310 [Nonomuraea sp. NPDC046802]|uniref:hypothetical protein n=1 Tax=Nonomuraea sp. NPDC046802 TaxID=3154919 RepID=UPI0033D18ADE